MSRDPMSSLLLRCLLAVALGLIGVAQARGQGAVEYGSVTAKSGAAAAAVKSPKLGAEAPAPEQPGATPLPAQTGEKVAAANRQAFAEQAGPDAAKVSLGSVPTGAQVWVDGKFIGAAPIELTLAPGPHRVEMRTAATEGTRQDVRLLPKQTRQVLLTLKPRYPQKIILH